MKNLNLNAFLGALSLSALLIFAAAARTDAQSTIILMPSTDIVQKRGIGIRISGTFKPVDQDAKKRFSSFTPRIIAGLGNNVEVGLNLTGNVQPGNDTTTLVGTVKWRMYYNEKNRVSIVTGNSFYAPLRNKKYDFGTYTYVQASKTIKKTGTRLTAGTYFYSKNVVAAKAARGGGQFALEQPFRKKFTFTTEWVTGKHSAGYLVPGLKIKLNKNLTPYFAYPISNSKASSGNHFFLAGLAINFNY